MLKKPNTHRPIRIKDLELDASLETIYGTQIKRLYSELAQHKISLRPRVYISDEWFSPDTSPTIAVPFYLLDRRIKKSAKYYLGTLEGETETGFMKLLRHECGHAVETAFKLKFNKTRQKYFGLTSEKYPSSYFPNLSSKSYISYLGYGYGQAHPSEDFAETFAFWLEFGMNSKTALELSRSARKKLCALDGIMKTLANSSPVNRSTKKIDCYKTNSTEVTSFLNSKRHEYRIVEKKKTFENLELLIEGNRPRRKLKTDVLPMQTSNRSLMAFTYELKMYLKSKGIQDNNYLLSIESHSQYLQSYVDYKKQKLHYFVM